MKQHTKFQIFDLDGTLFPETTIMKKNFRDSVVQAALELGAPFTFSGAHEIALDSQNTYNMSAYRFIHEFGMNRVSLFRRYNELLDETLIPLDHISPLRRAFALAAQDKSKRVLLSWATREWADKALYHMNARTLFDDDKIITAEDFDYLTKSESDLPILTALKILDARPEETSIYEDSKGCLKRAYDLGLKERIFIHTRHPLKNLPPFITQQYPDLVSALNHDR